MSCAANSSKVRNEITYERLLTITLRDAEMTDKFHKTLVSHETDDRTKNWNPSMNRNHGGHLIRSRIPLRRYGIHSRQTSWTPEFPIDFAIPSPQLKVTQETRTHRNTSRRL